MKKVPLSRATYVLLLKVLDVQNQMTKDIKHTIGRRLIDRVLDMMHNVRLATDDAEHRKEHLLAYLGNLDEVETLLKACDETCRIAPKTYTKLLEPLANCEKQAQGWAKSKKIDQSNSVGGVESSVESS